MAALTAAATDKWHCSAWYLSMTAEFLACRKADAVAHQSAVTLASTHVLCQRAGLMNKVKPMGRNPNPKKPWQPAVHAGALMQC